ncbi:hypothetical protein [Motilibacter deserti]|uniref:Uncharacterized protein n=1 Tax=Motilibacter deserti TaxID=2714956 RepID=A0ABX0GUI3_9ACTN|nr:hypothetical protein [Motilibacter deserti]NHC12948.1 hypothetical protein [Motilibacter deserti]
MHISFSRRPWRAASALVLAAAALVVPAAGAAPASAQDVTTITSNLSYEDSNKTGPIKFSKVEVWRFAPRTFGIWTWANERTVFTDDKGRINTSFPFVKDAIFALRVFATNSAAQVWPNDFLHAQPFWAEPGHGSQPVHLTSTRPNTQLTFNWHFADDWTPQHFNIAETIRLGRDYAAANRGDSDPLPRADVQPTSVTGSYYNPVNSTVVINSGNAFTDFAILHEYTHFLQDKIGSFPWLPAAHDGCITEDVFHNPVNTADHSWMEAFADWFPHAVSRAFRGEHLEGNVNAAGEGTFDEARLEKGNCGPLPASVTGDEVELFLAASLWDLTDDDTNVEPWDRFAARDRSIFQIFDKELDAAAGVGNPTIMTFRKAWNDRGLGSSLDTVLHADHVL